MTIFDDLSREVKEFFREAWSTRDGRVVPSVTDLRLGNDGIHLDAVILYADMAGSTQMVDTKSQPFAAEVYKAYLTCCARIIKDNDGIITAYDGDRIMAIFIGDYKNTNAVKAALKINWAMLYIIRPKLKDQYPSETFIPSHSVGIDRSNILAARIGIIKDNDIVWVGRAANYAAKLSGIREGNYTTFITKDVFDRISNEAKFTNGNIMWESRSWNKLPGMTIYRSNWSWGIDG